KALGTLVRGRLFALTGNASDAVRAITSGITSLRATGATLYEPFHLWYLAMAYAQIGQTDDARHCIDDAIDKVARSKEKWCEAERLPTASGVDLEAPDPRCCSANCESDVIFLLSLQDGWLANFIFRAIPVCDSLLVHALRPANTEIAMAQGDRLVDNGVNVEA